MSPDYSDLGSDRSLLDEHARTSHHGALMTGGGGVMHDFSGDDDTQTLEQTEQGLWWGSGRHLAYTTEDPRASFCHILPPSPRTSQQQAHRQQLRTGQSKFRCHSTAALDDKVFDATEVGLDALMRLSCANADCAEQLEWMEQQVLALQILKQEQEAEMQGLKNKKLQERELEVRQTKASVNCRLPQTQRHPPAPQAPAHHLLPHHAQARMDPERAAPEKVEWHSDFGDVVLKQTEHEYSGDRCVSTTLTYVKPQAPVASEMLQVQARRVEDGPSWQGARFR